MADLEEKVAYWKQVLADLGGLNIIQKDVKPGDLVKYLGNLVQGEAGQSQISFILYILPGAHITDVKIIIKKEE